MKIDNRTSIPADAVRAVLMFAAPPGVGGYDITITDYRRDIFRGRAICSGRGRVLLRLGTADNFPSLGWPSRRRGSGYLPVPPLGNRIEAFVYLAAHELRHLWQMRVPRGRRVWGARAGYSERDADAYAAAVLRRWRREGPPLAELLKPPAPVIMPTREELKRIETAKKYARIVARERAWQTRLKRATTALRKIKRQRAYYERTAQRSA